MGFEMAVVTYYVDVASLEKLFYVEMMANFVHSQHCTNYNIRVSYT